MVMKRPMVVFLIQLLLAIRWRFTRRPRVCGELLNLAENTSVAQSCESFTYC
jgi:hypothetical protein